MKEFKIIYFYEGGGETIITAKNEEEARGKFYSGDFNGDEWGEQYNIDKVIEMKGVKIKKYKINV